MSIERNRQDAESYYYNSKKNPADKFMWVCLECKTKNMKINNNCYNCGKKRK